MKSLKKNIEEVENRTISRIVNSIPNPVVFYNSSGFILMYNNSFSDAFQCCFKQNSTNYFYEIFEELNIDIQKKTDQMLLNHPGQGSEFESDLFFCNKGKMVPCLFSKVVITNDSISQIEGILCVIRDVSNLKQKHDLAIIEKQKELVYLKIRANKISKLNRNLIDKIKKLGHYLNKEGKKRLNELVEDNNYLSIENLLDEFEKQFLEIDKDFFDNLEKNHPDLTSSERKLCSYLKLNMTTRDISQLNGSNIKSVEMARYRLRQKLGLTSNVRLISYLSKF